MQHRTDHDKAKARVYQKARRRGLLLRSRRKLGRGEWRYTVIKPDGFELWVADYIEQVEYYLDKAPPSLWND